MPYWHATSQCVLAFNLLEVDIRTERARSDNYARNFTEGPLGHFKVERSLNPWRLPNDFAFSFEITADPAPIDHDN